MKRQNKNHLVRRLRLSRTTLRRLDQGSLQNVAGGVTGDCAKAPTTSCLTDDGCQTQYPIC